MVRIIYNIMCGCGEVCAKETRSPKSCPIALKQGGGGIVLGSKRQVVSDFNFFKNTLDLLFISLQKISETQACILLEWFFFRSMVWSVTH